MSVRLLKEWSCDEESCDHVIRQEGYGLPSGWIWIVRNNRTEHRCERCKTSGQTEEWMAAMAKMQRGLGTIMSYKVADDGESRQRLALARELDPEDALFP